MPEIHKLLKDHILGPAHVGFVVPSLEEAVDNAARVYGLREEDVSYQPPAGVETETRFAFFTVGGLEFELIEPCSEHFQNLLFAMPSGSAGINHMAWRVDDIAAAVSLLARQGIYPGHVTPGGIVTIGANKIVYFDPATTGGLLIELIEYPTDSADAS
jgi:methylmalonyl-CoA/ethylmalonyl-CoA epimerase